ncbi:MAG: alanine--tRNA ligase-related protein, partial [Chloroflexi bacterium]|nr:alanine--tRNA ligase-related protein [Chloroflexota bacterium]
TGGLGAFDKAMEAQRALARSTARFSLSQRPPTDVYQQLGVRETHFVGYTTCDVETELLALVGQDGERLTAEAGEEVEVILPETPFYAESGGQVGDAGVVESATGWAEITDTQRPLPGLIVHMAKVASGYLEKGQPVTARVGEDRRADIARHHSVTHLLHKALQQTLGGHAQQSGSLVAPDRLRFDFSHPSALTRDDLAQVERLVNQAIRADMPVETAITGYREALASGAMALFDEKYGDQVRLVQMGDYSRELCGGTHVRHTGEIGFFHIISETSVGTGLRRIEAVAGRPAEAYVAERLDVLRAIEERLPGGDPVERLEALQSELQAQRRDVARLERALAAGELESLLSKAEVVDGVRVLASQVNASSVERMREMGDWLRDRLGPSVIVLGAVIDSRPSFVAMVSSGLKYHAGQLIKEVASVTGGSGGGRPNLAQAGGRDASKIGQALSIVPDLVRRSAGEQNKQS